MQKLCQIERRVLRFRRVNRVRPLKPPKTLADVVFVEHGWNFSVEEGLRHLGRFEVFWNEETIDAGGSEVGVFAEQPPELVALQHPDLGANDRGEAGARVLAEQLPTLVGHDVPGQVVKAGTSQRRYPLPDAIG